MCRFALFLNEINCFLPLRANRIRIVKAHKKKDNLFNHASENRLSNASSSHTFSVLSHSGFTSTIRERSSSRLRHKFIRRFINFFRRRGIVDEIT